jgi:predicted MFS family arabinose efflux permease
VLAGLFMMRLPPWVPGRQRTSPWQGVVQVMRYMRKTPPVRALMLMVTVYSILGAPLLALMPVVAREMFGLGAGGYGLLLSFLGVGGLCGALGLAALGGRVSRIRLLTIASMLWPALLMVFSLTRAPLAGYLLLLAVGCVMILNGAISNGLLQGIVPDAFRGRIMAAYGLVVVGLAQVVGAFSGGLVAHFVGVADAIFAAGLLMAAYGVWAFLRRPELRELRQRTV